MIYAVVAARKPTLSGWSCGILKTCALLCGRLVDWLIALQRLHSRQVSFIFTVVGRFVVCSGWSLAYSTLYCTTSPMW